MINRFPPNVVRMLLQSGWAPGRNVLKALGLPKEFDIFPAAEQILREFGALRIGSTGPGIDCSASDVIMEPRLCAGLSSVFEEEEELIGLKLYPLGRVHRLNEHLVVASDGQIFTYGGEDFYWTAGDFETALIILLLGISTKR